jgi:small subunit ribosomal protein S6
LKEYEIVYIIRPDLADEQRSEKARRIHAMIEEAGGQLGEVEDWGTRVLAYEIDHQTEGHYGLATFKLPADAIKPFRDRLNIDEEILRYQIVSRSA